MKSRKRNVYNSNPTADYWNSFRIQRNKCGEIVRDARKNYYRKLDVSRQQSILENRETKFFRESNQGKYNFVSRR